ncbi:hypothetical protein B9479_006210 [Cryptococcus floricola]|uniref:Uncharacterized protein n=1 Tax=Cryptococcus floricola TaxID=2591691 RepID=A0A5D3AQY3_9TREE|nr:hypothetical protein B9479_006210 [Cryptococcus floricola]
MSMEKLRKGIHTMLTVKGGGDTDSEGDESDNESDGEGNERGLQGGLYPLPQAVTAFLACQPTTVVGQALKGILGWLAGHDMVQIRAEKPLDNTRRFLKQLFTKDTIFTFFPPPSFSDIDGFCRSGFASVNLRGRSPVIALIDEAFPNRKPVAFLTLIRELKQRASHLLTQLLDNASATTPLDEHVRDKIEDMDRVSPWDGEWTETGVCTGPQRRRWRPTFSGLRNDAGYERILGKTARGGGAARRGNAGAVRGRGRARGRGRGARNGGGQRPVEESRDARQEAKKNLCRKFYDSFGGRRLTGGLAGAWCPHGICVAYHLMPSSEGRDDFFSMLYCHWETAPEKVIIYDFACALAHYCMLRAPAFFRDTRFLIDELHAHNHTACSESGFLTLVMKNQPQYQPIYSSAAESGHAILRRVRKSLSYMNEAHANRFLYIAIQALNRRKLVNMGAEATAGA